MIEHIGRDAVHALAVLDPVVPLPHSMAGS
jgi:hypothetical protein